MYIYKFVLFLAGWDRTPLFISLLRISLWADGVIHETLNSYQLLYYTIAYDWMLFGHNLEDRLNKGEEIFFFCFYFLKHIHDEKFSVHTPRPNYELKSRKKSDNTMPNASGELFDIMIPNISPSGSDCYPPAVFHNDASESSSSQDDSENNGYVFILKLFTYLEELYHWVCSF